MKVAVIGAGTMGSGIAQTFAQAASVEKVYLCDIKTEFAEGGFAKIKKGLDSRLLRERRLRKRLMLSQLRSRQVSTTSVQMLTL